jgi:excisionase family DNA binding protein
VTWVTVNEAATIASVSRRTIYVWLKANKLRVTYTVSGKVRIDPSSLFQESRTPSGAAD